MAYAVVAGFLLMPSSAQAYDITFTLEGCRNDGSITFPQMGPFVCPDGDYTTGNLGKGWNELDFVPHRVWLKNAKEVSQSYRFVVASDNMAKMDTALGWDGISLLTLNPALSTGADPASCPVNPTGTDDPLASLLWTPDGDGVGGAYITLYRYVDIVDQPANTTCVYDYYQRLAVGSHEFSGSSLQSNLWNEALATSGIGAKKVSIPVKEILPQEIAKSMDGTRDQEQLWTVTKTGPSGQLFANTCPGEPQEKEVQLTVTWEKLGVEPTGEINVAVVVTATNPASRWVSLVVEDEIFAGATAMLANNFTCGFEPGTSTGPITVAPGSTTIVCSHSFTVPADTVALNDVATATYYDTFCLVPIEQTLEFKIDVVMQGVGETINAAIKIKEEEFFTDMSDNKYVAGAYTGAVWYSVDSWAGADGAFTSYTEGTPTQDPVEWISDPQSESGAIIFNKTIYVTGPNQESLKLADVAELTTVEGDPLGAPAVSDDFDFVIQCDAQVVLDIEKTIPPLLSPITIDFTVKDPDDIIVATRSITFAGGETVKWSDPIPGLEPGVTYTVYEDVPAIFASNAPEAKQIDLPICDGTVPILNLFNTAEQPRVQVKKITVPAGQESGWDFDLYKVVAGGPDEFVSEVTTVGTDYEFFATGLGLDLRLQYGESYYVVETLKGGWEHTATMLDGSPVALGNCSFHVTTNDQSHTFQCAFTNTQQGKIVIEKETDPDGSAASFEFASDYGSAFALMDGESNDSGWLTSGTYEASEGAMAGWDLVSVVCDDQNSNGSVANSTAYIDLDPGETVTCTFTNRQRGTIIINKFTDPSGGTGFAFANTIAEPFTFTLDDYQTETFLEVVAGNYLVSEDDPAPGYTLSTVTCIDSDEGGVVSSGNPANLNADINLDPGETVECTFINKEQGYFEFIKLTNGADLGAMTPLWNFTLTGPGVDVSATTPPSVPFGEVRLGLDEIYTFCESGIGPGWTTEWYYGASSELPYVGCEGSLTGEGLFQVYDPDPSCGVPLAGYSNDTRCVNFRVVEPASTAVFTINNMPPPGGDQRTIGYWKNWNTCSGGNQQYTEGAFLLDHALSQWLGSLEIGTCDDGRNIVDKRAICEESNYAKMASDAAYGLASQLLAAKANIAADAGQCGQMFDAVNAADALLSRIGFTGCDLCLPPDVGGNVRIKKVRNKVTKVRSVMGVGCAGATREDRMEALELAGVLDDYNNGWLCPAD